MATYETLLDVHNTLRDLSGKLARAAPEVQELAGRSGSPPDLMVIYAAMKLIEGQTDMVVELLWPHVRDLERER